VEYEEAEALIDSLLPTNRFSDDLLWIVAAIKWHILAEWQFTSWDTVGWHMTRVSIKRAITHGYVKVLGGGNPPGKRKIDRLITEFYQLTDPTGWVTRKRGFTGVATYMVPSDTFLTALWTLPEVREDSPILVVPILSPEGEERAWMEGQQTTPVEAIATPSPPDTRRGWLHLRNDGVARTVKRAAWNYDNRLGRKAAVLWALRRAGVEIYDHIVGEYEFRPRGWKSGTLKGYETVRWVKLPEGMTERQLVHIVEGKL